MIRMGKSIRQLWVKISVSAAKVQIPGARMRQDLLFNCQRRLEYLGSRLQDLAMELGDGQGAVWLKSNMW